MRLFFRLSAEWWLQVGVPKLFGGFRQLGARLSGKSGVLGSEKSMVFNLSSQEKLPGSWRGGLSRAGFGDNTELLPSVPGDAPGKRKGR